MYKGESESKGEFDQNKQKLVKCDMYISYWRVRLCTMQAQPLVKWQSWGQKNAAFIVRLHHERLMCCGVLSLGRGNSSSDVGS